MIITHYGQNSFKVQFADTVLAFDPVSKSSRNGKPARFGADVVLSSLNHPDMNGFEALSIGGRNPFLISGPGEYEIKGVFIKGFPTKTNHGSDSGKEKINTIYLVVLEDINLCFLGALNSGELSSETWEELGDVDILFVPVGGGGMLSAEEAYKFSLKIGPKIIIPMSYGQVPKKGIKALPADAPLRVFLKEEGAEDMKPLDKLTIKKKDMAEDEKKIIVLKNVNT